MQVNLAEYFDKKSEEGLYNRVLFEKAVETDDRKTISVIEVNNAFNELDKSVGEHVSEVAGQSKN